LTGIRRREYPAFVTLRTAAAAVLVSTGLAFSSAAAPGPAETCLRDSGRAGTGCLRGYLETIEDLVYQSK